MGNSWGSSGSGNSEPARIVSDMADERPAGSGPYMGNRYGLSKDGLDNRANQLNPNHAPTGPGRPAGYHGAGTKEDLDNHANQLNPNNSLFRK